MHGIPASAGNVQHRMAGIAGLPVLPRRLTLGRPAHGNPINVTLCWKLKSLTWILGNLAFFGGQTLGKGIR